MPREEVAERKALHGAPDPQKRLSGQDSRGAAGVELASAA